MSACPRRGFLFPIREKPLRRLLPFLVVLAGCVPGVVSAPAPGPRSCVDPNASVDQAIDCAFESLGLQRQDEAHRVAQCESGKNPMASNGGVYLGVFQLHHTRYANTVAFYGGNFFDPYVNASVARDSVKVNNGWVRWQCKP